MERNVPKLRFKEFNDEWIEYKLGEKTCIYDGTHQTPKYTDHGVKFVSVENIEDIYGTDKFISEEDYENGFKIKPQLGDIFMTRITAGVIGATAIVDKEEELAFYVSLALIRVIDKNLNSLFLKKYIESIYFKKELNKRIIHVAFPKKINLGDIGECSVNLPSLQEQERIANFLTKVDKIIEKQEEKVKNLENYKKGMMQKIFSQEIRFKDENGNEYPEWNKEHLGNLVERVVRKNKGNISNRPLTISAQYGLVDQEEFFNKVVASSNLEGYYLLENGEFAYNKSYSNGYPFGAIKRLDKYDDGAVSTLYICFKPKNGLSSDFLCHYFESDMWHKEVAMVAVEGARNHGLLNISVGDFFDTLHKVPCKKEQIQIANFLNNISNLLYKEENKFKELQKWKKALLQQMFV